jgi:hypothetical protein
VLGLVTLVTVAGVESDQVALQLLVGLLGGAPVPIRTSASCARLVFIREAARMADDGGLRRFPGMAWFVWGPFVLLALPAVFVSRRAS